MEPTYSLDIATSYKRAYKKLPENIKTVSKETLKLLVENPFHPGLRTKKNNQASDKFMNQVLICNIGFCGNLKEIKSFYCY